MTVRHFDVFLAHSSQDKPVVRQLYQQLRARGMTPWLDEEEIRPGTAFMKVLKEAVSSTKTAAVCIGTDGLGAWQEREIMALIERCVQQSVPVIPVLLPGVAAIPKDLTFLKLLQFVSFQGSIDEPHALDKIEWGITGIKPKNRPKESSRSSASESIVSSALEEPVSKDLSIEDNLNTLKREYESQNMEWAGDWFVNVGEGSHRTWKDCVKMGSLVPDKALCIQIL